LNIKQVAAQLYSLKGHTDTEADIAMSLKRVKAMGYDAVQVSGLGPIDPKMLASMLSDNGLVCCATHEPSDNILDKPAEVIEKLKILKCYHTAYPYPGGVDLHSEQEVTGWIKRLDAVGKIYREAGITLSYHNHHVEFRKLGGKLILDRIFDQTDPANLKAELDTYWVQYGGGDPVTWVKKYSGRQPLIHLKDYMIDEDFKPQYADIGAGNLDMPAIICAAEKAGVEWFIVERDPAPGDPFESLQASYDYLRDVIAEY
jgi:sugar phosphate isomerase/epimerase